MDLGLEGKLVLVTGGSKGIGFACAQTFHAEGARVAICSRSQGNVDAAVARLHGAFGVAADCAHPDAALAMLDRVEGALGPIDVLVNSAGAARRTPPPDLTPAVWRGAFDAKFFSYVNVIDPLVKRMAARGSGVIVNVIGAGGKMASSTHLAGGSANAALMLATAGLGAAYAASGVRVVGVSPGLTETDRVAEGLAAEFARLRREHGGGSAPQRRAPAARENGDPRGDRERRRFPRLGQGELCHRHDPRHGRRAVAGRDLRDGSGGRRRCGVRVRGVFPSSVPAGKNRADEKLRLMEQHQRQDDQPERVPGEQDRGHRDSARHALLRAAEDDRDLVLAREAQPAGHGGCCEDRDGQDQEVEQQDRRQIDG